MTSLRTRSLVSCAWLRKQLSAHMSHKKGTPHMTVLDATSAIGKDSNPDFIRKHLPSAQFFDQNRCVIPTTFGARTLPEADCFAAYTQALGVSGSRQVVVYDRGGMAASARAWWTFRAMGHRRVSVLDGGLPCWNEASQPTLSNHVRYQAVPGDFSPQPRPELVKNFESMCQILEGHGDEQIIDARSPRSFWGEDNHMSRAITAVLRSHGLSSDVHVQRGHIPGSISLPAGQLLAHDGKLRTPAELSSLLGAVGIDLTRPLVALCYNGDLACLVALAAAVCGKKDVAVYLGSWLEWGQRADSQLVINGKGKASVAVA